MRQMLSRRQQHGLMFGSKRSSAICDILMRFRVALFAEVASGGHLRASDPGLEPMSLTLESREVSSVVIC